MARITEPGGVTLQKNMAFTERRMLEARDYLRGLSQVELADKYEVSQATVSRDLEAIRQEWLHSTLVDFNAAKAQELAKIDNMERTYWDAWERSVGEHIKTRMEKSSVKGDKAIVMKETLVGDPRFLQGVQWCIEQRCKLFGLYEAAKIDITWREEAERAGIDTGDLFEQLVNNYVSALASGDAAITGRGVG